MKLLVSNLPRTVALSASTHALTFRQVGRREPKAEVHLVPNAELGPNYRHLIRREVFGCLGLVNVGGAIYVAVVTGASTNVASPLPYETVDRIYSVDFVLLSLDEWDFVNLDANGMPVPAGGDESDDHGPRAVHPCFEFRKLLSNGLFYYSNDFDLTLMLQTRGVDSAKLRRVASGDTAPGPRNPKSGMHHIQEQFMWNLFLMEELLRFRANLDDIAASIVDENRFFTTAIRGFAKTVRYLQGTISIVLKQLWRRAGTRFNARGIDDDGNVANFVETEFICHAAASGHVFAFTQVRGSVPGFWEQDLSLINPKITITRSRDATQPAFDRHFDDICHKYGVCHVVNLLLKTKPAEVEVSRRYTDLLQHSEHRDELLYLHFDFHAETKPAAGGFAGATKILTQLRDSIERFGWFDYDIQEAEVITRQDGVFRVNCLDCLDRTNLIEQVICQTLLEHIVGRSDDIVSRHNALWADNGDAISQIYTGTNALKSSFSRSGKMNIAGALLDVTKSVSRMYQNTFVDLKKQSVIDALLGKDLRLLIPVKIFDPISDFVSDKIRQNEATFTTYSSMTMFTGTFNVNAMVPRANADIEAWLFPAENQDQFPDIYGIGLQELIELNAGLILAADSSRATQWAKVLHLALNSRGEYLLLRTESLALMALYFFVKKDSIDKVTQVSGSSKKTGMGGMTANKGACAVRFEYGSTLFALVTSHFAAGVNATMERHNDYVTIWEGLTFTRNYTIGDHDHVVWFGDLNYRINLPNDRCRYLLERGAFDELLLLDQLGLEMAERGGPFAGFKEERILFYPTYKFDKGTSSYDTSEKQRVPSWTDRVLYKSKTEARSLNYNSVMDIMLSDHKPVYSTLQCKVKFVDEQKKKELTVKYYLAYKEDDTRSSEASSLADSMQELNLLELDAPALPARNLLTKASLPAPKPLPRRVPPPPMARRAESVGPGGALVQGSNGGTTLPLAKPLATASSSTSLPAQASSTAPPPPPSRQVNIAFNAMPLTPTQSMSATSTGVSSTGVPSSGITLPVRPASVKSPLPVSTPSTMKPLKPSKPGLLLATKVDGPEEPEEPVKPKAAAPPPPPARAVKTMSDWKPLMPGGA